MSPEEELYDLACQDMPVTRDEVREALDKFKRAYAHELAERQRRGAAQWPMRDGRPMAKMLTGRIDPGSPVADILPEFLATYLGQRDAARAEAVNDTLASLTNRERALVKDAAVMGYARGTMAPKGEPIPKDRAILAEVIDACLAFPDLYPAVNAAPEGPSDG